MFKENSFKELKKLKSGSSNDTSGCGIGSARSCKRSRRKVRNCNVAPCESHTIIWKTKEGGCDHAPNTLFVWIGRVCGQVTCTTPMEKKRWTWPFWDGKGDGGVMWPLPSTHHPQVRGKWMSSTFCLGTAGEACEECMWSSHLHTNPRRRTHGGDNEVPILLA